MGTNKNKLETEFIAILRQHERIIYKAISFYADEENPAGDLFQETVLNLWKAFPNFRNESAYSTWIYRIALNTCVSFFRKGKNKPVFVEVNYDVAEIPSSDEDIKELYRLISQLGKLDRALVFLYLEEKSYKEIAEISGLTISNVATKLNRIKEKLKGMSNQ